MNFKFPVPFPLFDKNGNSRLAKQKTDLKKHT